ncbi:MAG: hypothetical protein PUH24_06900 [Prevotellaceae bacterium]|nr:hypothetical protein [Prevotella sp.]MDD7257976.1 hypothetical protein [Prevotellaceae bacterium]MDY6131460.1 hypothetical protein [Prevotella sp.]
MKTFIHLLCSLAVLLLAGTARSNAQTPPVGPHIGNLAIRQGETILVPIFIGEPSRTYHSFGFDIYLPAGFSIDETKTQLNPNKTDGHFGGINMVEDGRYRVMVMVDIIKDLPFKNVDEYVMVFPLTCHAETATGTYDVKIKDISYMWYFVEEDRQCENPSDFDVKLTVADAATFLDATISPSGFGTFYSDKALDFSHVNGIENIYVVSTISKTNAILTEITDKKIPANTAVLLKGNTGTYTIPSIPNANPIGMNLLMGTSTDIILNPKTEDKTNFILKNGKFVKVSGGILKANKAYLPVSTQIIGEAKEISFDTNEPTTIQHTETEKQGENTYYNLYGIQVSHPQKGIYVSNGKKIIIP